MRRRICIVKMRIDLTTDGKCVYACVLCSMAIDFDTVCYSDIIKSNGKQKIAQKRSEKETSGLKKKENRPDSGLEIGIGHDLMKLKINDLILWRPIWIYDISFPLQFPLAYVSVCAWVPMSVCLKIMRTHLFRYMVDAYT